MPIHERHLKLDACQARGRVFRNASALRVNDVTRIVAHSREGARGDSGSSWPKLLSPGGLRLASIER